MVITNTEKQQESLDNQNFSQKLKHFKERFNLIPPELEMTFSDPNMGVEGFVVVWNTKICKGGPLFTNGRGCGKGGTRIQKGLSIDDVKRLACAMAEKKC